MKENEYSLLSGYKDVLELLSQTMEAHSMATLSGVDESREDEEMYNIMNTAYDLMVRADALIADEDSYILIDENHPLYEGGEAKLQFKYAVSNLDTAFLKEMSEKITRADIVKVIKKNMTEQGLSTYKVAEKSGIPEATIRRFLSGESKASLDAVLAILESLDVTVNIID